MTTSARAPRIAPEATRPSGRAAADRGVLDAVRRGLPAEGPIVLAVSGGLDSSVLLDAAARVIATDRLTVATFDHGTGRAAREAAAQVAARCAALGIRAEVGAAERPLAGEAAWRAARWDFLRAMADRAGGPVATAHTRDDQVETVALRILRDAGARGLAGLFASNGRIVRPFLSVSRATLERYASRRKLSFVVDPSNASPKHARNRVRHDLLPAMRRVRPSIDRELLAIGERAAAWRREVDALALTISSPAEDGGVRVARHSLAGYDPQSLAVVWTAVAAIAGITLDRRGTRRLASFTRIARTGARVPLSGGAQAVRERDSWWIGRPTAAAAAADREEHALADGVAVGSWRFSCIEAPVIGVEADPRWATLPNDLRITVRAWRDGDRLAGGDGVPARRVKRWLAEAGVAGPERRGWPVVLADGEIVWIPGVRRSDAASVRSGRPGLCYLCERNLR